MESAVIARPLWNSCYLLTYLTYLTCITCIKDSIKIHAEKMVKICQAGLLKLNFEIRPKKTFSGFCQKFPQAMDEVEIFLPFSKSLDP
jgi:hypothetical protein